MDSRAETQGPSGFSLASIMIASAGGWCSRARASIGSVTTRSATAAEAAVDSVKNERRDVEAGMRLGAIIHLVAAILPQKRMESPWKVTPGGLVSRGGRRGRRR